MDGRAYLDPPGVTAEQFDTTAQRLGELLATESDVLLFPAEATVALEAVAKSTAHPGATVVNVVSGPYGRLESTWLADAGVNVVEVETPFDRAPTAEEVGDAVDRHSPAAVFVTHAEAACGTVCWLEGIAALVKRAGAILVVDAVASAAAEPLDVDGWGIDVCVIGAQKAMAGPAGISGVLVNPAAWSAIEAHPAPPRRSVLSLFDWKGSWIDTDRRSLPVIPAPLEVAALGAALDRLGREGVGSTVRRHRSAAAASRAGVEALGLVPWVAPGPDAAAVATTVRLPAGSALTALDRATLAAAGVTAGPGPLAAHLLRINHTGRAARLDVVLDAVGALARVLRPGEDDASGADLTLARGAAVAAWSAAYTC